MLVNIYTTSLYHAILDVHGWREIGEKITTAFKQGDFKSMAGHVIDAMVDAIAIAGTPEDVRDQLQQWQGLTEQVLFYSPSLGIGAERIYENLVAITETFSSTIT